MKTIERLVKELNQDFGFVASWVPSLILKRLLEMGLTIEEINDWLRSLPIENTNS